MSWFQTSRPVNFRPFGGLSWADYYRVVDAVAGGQGVTDPRLADVAVEHGRQTEKSGRLVRWLLPLYIVTRVLDDVGDPRDRPLPTDLVLAVFVVAMSVHVLVRAARARQSIERTRPL